MGGDDADVGSDPGKHLLVVVEQGGDAEAFAECLELFAAPVDPRGELAARVEGDRLGVVVGKIAEAELVADTAGADDGDAVGVHLRRSPAACLVIAKTSRLAPNCMARVW